MSVETVTGDAIRVSSPSPDLENLLFEVARQPAPRPGPGECLVEVMAAGVNPSDVKAILGNMPHAVWPRTPGRDYAGIVREGPAELVGLEVWGGGGELGIRRDGTHARWLVLDAAAVRAKPANLTLDEAGAIGVPFHYRLRRPA
jgi:NADPH:quinone reductase